MLEYSLAAKNTDMNVVKDLWCSSLVWLLKIRCECSKGSVVL